MQYSITPFKKVRDLETFRFDAEYFHPEYLEIEKAMEANSAKFTTLNELKIKIDASAFYPPLEPFYGQGKLPFIRVVDTNDFVDYQSVLTIPEEILKDYRTVKLVERGDIIVTKGGSIARVGLIDRRSAVCRDLIFFKTSRIGDVNYSFIFVYFLTDIYKKMLIRSSSMTAQPHLTITLVKNLPIFNPSLDFKTCIFEMYSKSKSCVDESIKRYSSAEQILLSELGLKDWKPKHQLSFVKNFSESRNANRMDAEYFQPKHDELKRMINRGKCIPLGKCFDLISSNYFDYVDDGDVGVIKTKQLSGRFISFEVESKTSKKILEDNGLPEVKDRDVLFASMGVGSLGKANTYYEFENDAKTKFTVDSTIRIMRQNPNSEIGPELLALYLSSIVGQELIYQNIVGTSGIISIYRTYLEHLPIPLLDQKIQDTLSAHILQAHKSRMKAKKLLDIAKRGVEIAIEQGEAEAHNRIDQEIKGIPSS